MICPEELVTNPAVAPLGMLVPESASVGADVVPPKIELSKDDVDEVTAPGGVLASFVIELVRELINAAVALSVDELDGVDVDGTETPAADPPYKEFPVLPLLDCALYAA